MSVAVARRDAGRARYPDDEGYVERDGVRVFYEVYGAGEPTVFLLPTWSLVHSRVWKAQVHYLARHFRVLTFDGRGNGRSDRPAGPRPYRADEFVADAFAVMDATGTERVVNVSLSAGTFWSLGMAAVQPERVIGAVFIGPTPYAVAGETPDWMHTPFDEQLASHDGANRYNRHFIRERYSEFADWWMRLATPERHSTRPIEFAVGMALETDAETILATIDARGGVDATCAAEMFSAVAPRLRAAATRLHCPVLVIQGGQDAICPPAFGRALAQDTGGELLLMPEAGHVPHAREPVQVNLALRDFIERVGG